MDKKYPAAMRRFGRADEFLTTNQVEGTAVKLQVLKDVITEMTERGVSQDANERKTRGETRRQKALRDALWYEHMMPLARISRRASGAPGADPELKLPPRTANSAKVLNSARGMAAAAERHAEVLVQQEGLPADFLEKFKAAIDALASVVPIREETLNRRKESGAALAELVKRGVAALDVLDAIVTPRLQDKPDLLATWKNVKRPIEPGGASSPAPAQPDITPAVKAA